MPIASLQLVRDVRHKITHGIDFGAKCLAICIFDILVPPVSASVQTRSGSRGAVVAPKRIKRPHFCCAPEIDLRHIRLAYATVSFFRAMGHVL